MGSRTVKYGKKAERINYSKMKYDIELPNLIEIQTNSFQRFLDSGITELLQNVSPIEGLYGDLRLYFEEHFFSEPKYDIQESKARGVNYSRQLSARVKLENVLTGEVRENVVLMAEIPMMTPNGTFIINGAERAVVSQIVRSASAYYSDEFDKKLNITKYSAQVIPTRGAWLEYSEGSKNIFYANLDRSKKIPMTTLIRTLGLSKNKEIQDLFLGKSKLLDETFAKDETRNSTEAVVELYSKLHQGEIIPHEAARDSIRQRLFDNRRYDLANVGRFKFNQKLDVLKRIINTYSEYDIMDPETGEIIINKDELITKSLARKLEDKRHLLRKEVIKAENSIQNEASYEIFARRLPEGGDLLYLTENIAHLRTGEVLITKGTEVNDELLMVLRKNRQHIDDKYVKYFLSSKNVYDKEKEREGVICEIIDVYKLEENTNKKISVRIIGNDQRENRNIISVSDIIASISYYFNLYNGIGNVDDIDHLGNRRLRLIDELLKNQFRVGLARSEKNIKDKMSTTSFTDATPSGLINMSPLASAIKTFFGSSQLSQFMDQVNPLAELTQKRRVSALGTGGLSKDRAGVEVRDVHNSHYGRICPIETPEGPSIGLISSLSTYSKVDEYGFIQTPYLIVEDIEKDGKIYKKITDTPKYLTADEEYEEYIASAASPLDENGYLLEEEVIGRHKGETGMIPQQDITYMDVAPKQIVSVATSTIPFLEHDDALRALMGANMQRQAVPLLIPESPIVGTGIEHKIAKDSGVVILAKNTGFVTYVDAEVIVVTSVPTEKIELSGKVLYDPKNTFDLETAIKLNNLGLSHQETYPIIRFLRSNQDTNFLQKPIVSFGEFVEKGDVLADGPSTENGELALGRNVVVAFMTWDGYNYEDAVIMSEDLVKDDVYTSIHIDKYEVVTRDLKTGGGKEEITNQVTNAKGEVLAKLDENGIIIEGTEVKEGDILVGKITPKGSGEPSPAERLIQAIIGEKSREYRDSSLRVKHGDSGVVQKIQYYSRKNGDALQTGINEQVIVYVAKKRKISEGDKMAGRHGNKGVISKILPREDMPYMADGTPIDIMLNPLGVPSRMNLGQVLEIHIGLAAKKLGLKIATPVFDGASDQDIKDLMKQAGIDEDGKTVLYDGRTGLPYDNRVSVGVMYMIKLSHMVDDKMHSRNVGPYTLVTQQPMGGKAQNGGQRFGEMEVWALYAYGAAYTLQEMLTVKSDDMLGRNRVYSAISYDKPIPKPSMPESFRVLTKELQALGLYVELVNAQTGENDAQKSLVYHQPKGGMR